MASVRGDSPPGRAGKSSVGEADVRSAIGPRVDDGTVAELEAEIGQLRRSMAEAGSAAAGTVAPWSLAEAIAQALN